MKVELSVLFLYMDTMWQPNHLNYADIFIDDVMLLDWACWLLGNAGVLYSLRSQTMQQMIMSNGVAVVFLSIEWGNGIHYSSAYVCM